MKTYLITGVGGFIGSALARRLLETGNCVYGVDYKENDAIISMTMSDNFHFVCAGFDDYSSIKVERKIDTVIHLAWIGVSGKEYSSYQSQIKNIMGTIDAISMAKNNSANTFLFIDSSHEYQKNLNLNNELGFSSVYGAAKKSAKAFAQVLCHEIGINLKCVAFTNVYGAGDYSNRSANSIIAALIKVGKVDLIEGNNLHDWVYISDAVDGIISVDLYGKTSKVYYVGSSKLPTFKEIIIRLKDEINPSAELNFGKYNDSSFIDYSYFDLESLKNDCNFSPKISIEEGGRKTLEWLRSIKRI